MAYLSGYSKYKVLTLTGGASGAFTDFQLKLAVAYEAAMQGDFDDLRFTQADGTTLIDAWAEVIVTDTSATVWAEFPTTPANTAEQIYRMYYGNASAASDWDIGATFIFGDGFDSLAAWSQIGTPSVTGSELTLNSGEGVYADVSFPSSYCVHGRIKDASQTTDSSRFFIGTDNTAGNSGPYIGWRSDAKLYEYSAGWASMGAYASNVYNTVEMRNVNPTAHTWDAVVDNVVGITGAGFYSSVTPSRIILTANNVNCYADWIFVRKYAANPPTYAFGAEQSVPNSYWYYEMLKRRNS